MRGDRSTYAGVVVVVVVDWSGGGEGRGLAWGAGWRVELWIRVITTPRQPNFIQEPHAESQSRIQYTVEQTQRGAGGR